MAARRDFGKLGGALAAGTLAALAVWGLGRTPPGQLLELKARDSLMRATIPSPGGHPDVVMILVTEDDLETVSRKHKVNWPWARDVFGSIFSACGQGKASVVLFDFFTLADPGDGEPELVDALKESPPVYSATPFYRDALKKAEARPDFDRLLDRYALRVDNDGSVEIPDEYLSVRLPQPGIAEALAGACDVSTPRDLDGMMRRYRLISRFRGRYYPSFALAALLRREGVDRVEVRDRRVRVGKFSIPVDRDGTLRLRFYPPTSEPGGGAKSFRLLSSYGVMAGGQELESGGKVTTFDPKSVENRIVIVGTDAAALFDLKVTPVARQMMGCEMHAVALANIMRGDALREVPAAVSFLAALLLGVVAAVVTRFTPAGAGAGAAAGLLVGVGVLNGAVFRSGWVVELTPSLVSAGIAYAATSAVNFLTEGRQRRRTRREFSRYLSPKVVDKILLNPDGLRMEGERKVLTIFFMDFAGFTSMSETLDPTELVRLVSQYHNEAAEEIFRTEGTIDKYIGDAIMAFWNDPIEQPDHAVRACLTAVGAQRRLREFAARMKAQGLPEMHARMGINTGIATVGNFGAQGQVNYTVMGDEVNLASRLEGVNKEFGTDIIASEATYGPARDRVEARELALIKVKGKKHPVRIFELLGPRGEVDPARLEAARAFERGLEAFRARRFEEALDLFRPAAAGGDRAARVHLELCERYRKEPPPADWDGSYQMMTK
jgi:adenylate cyclase